MRPIESVVAMKSPFDTIQYGPFSTEYHRRAVDDQFRASLEAYLSKELLPQVDEPFESTAGTLQAEVNEERFCGPHSLVKDLYSLEFAFVRPTSTDELTAKIRWNARMDSFQPRYKHQPLFLWTAQRKNENRAFERLAARLARRSEQEHAGPLECPRCGSDLRLTDTPDLFDLSCPRGCYCFGFHRDPATREFRNGHFLSGPPRGG
jgi:hypothetical protein